MATVSAEARVGPPPRDVSDVIGHYYIKFVMLIGTAAKENYTIR